MTERPVESRPKNRLAADTIIKQGDRIVLIRRKFEPFKGQWCIPGGHVEHGEQVENAAKREAKEETGLDIELDTLFGVYDDPGRDPRGPIVSIVYTATTQNTALSPTTDAEDAKWFPINDLPDELGFDHAEILDEYREQRRE